MGGLKPIQRLVLCMGVYGVVISIVVTPVTSIEDLYRVLGVPRSASQEEIRNAYRKQAKLWHPDKNKSPEARNKFTDINGAYEVLSDSEKRRNYDITGRVGDSLHPTGHPRGHGFSFFQGAGGFHFQFQSGPTHRSDGIDTKQFYDDVLVNSHHKPYLLNFYTDFCIRCANVEVIWRSLHKELSSLGVTLGSVHARMHPRVTQYCGVSHVPSIVGVVSGRVYRYYGQLRDQKTMSDFLENILPKHLIPVVTEDNVESFLSKAILRNRPRLILFSPRESPSLPYKLTAFAHQKVADFGLVSTHPRWENGKVLQRFGVLSGDKKLAVFKEVYHPTSVTKGALNQAVLQATLEGLTLLLPRLSSQLVFDTVCPLAGNSFCVILAVDGSSAYNDSLTTVFRRMATEKTTILDSFAYIDTVKQAEFLAPLTPAPGRLCPSGGRARPVLILRRSSNLFDWFDQFCGKDADVDTLLAHLSSLRTKSAVMKYVPYLQQLCDEEAPGWFGQMWNRVAGFFLDLNDFLLALDSGTYTPMVSLLFAILIFCMVGLCIGTPEDDKAIRPRHQTRQQHAHSTSHVSHRNGRNGHHPYQSTHTSRQPQLYELNQHNYMSFVLGQMHAQIALVILIDTHQEVVAKQVVQSFWEVANKYKDRRLKLCYLCYRTKETWFEDILSQCSEIESGEIKQRTSTCLSGEVATVIALLGSKKQFCLFPEVITPKKEIVSETHILARGVRTGTSLPRNESDKPAKRSQSVGDILGSVFDFNDNDDVELVASTKGDHNVFNQSTDDHTKCHQNGGVKESCVDTRPEQIRTKFETWMDKFADGTLKRYRVDRWPKLRTV